MVTHSKAGIHKAKVYLRMAIEKLMEPRTYNQAAKHSTWQQAMLHEFEALNRNKTWHLVSPPAGCKIIGSKWVFKLKLKPNGSIEHHKARLLAKGYHQSTDINYFEIFSPMVKPTTIRIVLASIASYNWDVRQLDIHNAFLHDDLSEDVYMEPQGFVDPSHPMHMCKLDKALYGLKKSPHARYNKLSHFLI